MTIYVLAPSLTCLETFHEITMSANPWDAFWLERLQKEIRSRNYSHETAKNYSLALRTFLLWRPGNPKERSVQDIRSFLSHLQEEKGLNASTVNLYREGLAFFYQHILGKPFLIRPIPRLKEKQALPDVLDSQSVAGMMAAAENPKHRLALSLAYGCGLRVSELAGLQVADIDFARGTVFVRQGKGKKDRVVMLPSSLIHPLKDYLDTYRPLAYLFESTTPGKPLSKRTFQLVFKGACSKAGIKQKGGIHSLRHTFATHLLETGTNLKFIQVLLGHSRMETTERYTRVAATRVAQIQSPLDSLVLQTASATSH